MSTNFGTIASNVGNRVQDTSTTFATIIKTYINQRYKDILKRINWNIIIDDYVVTATAGTKDCTLPASFGKELYVHNITSLTDIPYLDFEKLEAEYQKELSASGTVEYYSIFNTVDSTAASASRVKKIRFWRNPSSADCFSVPYIMNPPDLSASGDTAVLDIDRAIEFGATCDAWLYKRQFAKAQAYEALYEKEIQNLIWEQGNQPNQLPLMNTLPLNRNDGI